MSYTPKRDVPVFRQENNSFIPTVLAQGPWYANSLHGSSMMALMAHAAEQFPSDIPRLVSRLTVDMMRAAPMAALTTEVKVMRSGKNVEFLDIHLLSDGKLYIRGSAMRIRVQDVTIDDYFRGIEPFPALPEKNDDEFFRFPGAENPGYHHVIDMRMDEHQGFPILWFKLAVPAIEGFENSSIVKLAAACDWTYAVPNIVHRRKTGIEMDQQTFFAINPDTTINFFRPVEGDWVGLKAQAAYGDLGSGTCAAQLFDCKGPVGFSSQTVLIRGNEGAPLRIKEKSMQSEQAS